MCISSALALFQRLAPEAELCLMLFTGFRTWALIFGGAFQLMIFLPTLRHFRILNILAIIGTTYTVW